VVTAPADLGVGVDAAIVERILAPILDNAFRYAQQTVTVCARRAPDSVVIEVSDDGPGVAPDVRDDVFEPGRRGAGGDGHDGAGLGLALARRLARAAAGDVTLGAGSVFVVRLPPA
jgi:signal transduction histidine kinase